MSKPRLLIEEWLPVQAIGIECMRERATGQQPPDKRLHVWWARRPLTISRAAVLGSLLPAEFDRECFERLLGFGLPGTELIRLRKIMDSGVRLGGFPCKRAFNNAIPEADACRARAASAELWGSEIRVIDTMSGGGAIPLEASRLGFCTLANELNPVACSVLEATVDYPFRHGRQLAEQTRRWAAIWRQRVVERITVFFPEDRFALCDGYLFARTVPCPDTGHPTPLVPDWSLNRPKRGAQLVAEPVVVDMASGRWTIRVRSIGKGAGAIQHPPQPTYANGDGVSLFTRSVIPDDYIKAMAQQGRLGAALYAVATRATAKIEFRPPDDGDRKALESARLELERLRPQWESQGIIPVEAIPVGDKTGEPLRAGMQGFADMFSPRQLLALGVMVEELANLRSQIVQKEGVEIGEAITHLLALVVDKLANWNAILSSWNVGAQTPRSVFDRHDYAFKATYCEMATCVDGSGLDWAIDSVLEAYDKLAQLPHAEDACPVQITQGSATSLPHLDDGSVTAVVVDPPYADNVQYSELADFFYVWLKRTQGHRRPEWFSTYLCDHDQEAVVNISRHRDGGKLRASEARAEAHRFYQGLMTDVFKEAHRILRDDGALTVMFTHKKQEAWAALFGSLIDTGFTITATFPVQTEQPNALNQAKKNAAQSTVILVSRKRDSDASMHYYDEAMQEEIRQVAREAAARLRAEGLNPVDQLVGAFGPAMEVFSRYDQVRRDTGEPVGVDEAIQAAADAVAEWRVEQLAQRGLEGVDPESRFYLLCWDVLSAAEFRFNEASLLGKAVGMDVSRMKDTGLVSSVGEKVRMLPASDRRRDKAVKSELEQLALFASNGKKKSGTSRKVNPNDEFFSSAVDMCHALAMRFTDGVTEQNGIANAKTLANQQGWGKDSTCAKLMEALIQAAPVAVRFPGKGKKKTAADDFPEFRAWHSMLKPLFGIEPPEWKEPETPLVLIDIDQTDEEDAEEGGEE